MKKLTALPFQHFKSLRIPELNLAVVFKAISKVTGKVNMLSHLLPEIDCKLCFQIFVILLAIFISQMKGIEFKIKSVDLWMRSATIKAQEE